MAVNSIGVAIFRTRTSKIIYKIYIKRHVGGDESIGSTTFWLPLKKKYREMGREEKFNPLYLIKRRKNISDR